MDGENPFPTYEEYRLKMRKSAIRALFLMETMKMDMSKERRLAYGEELRMVTTALLSDTETMCLILRYSDPA